MSGGIDIQGKDRIKKINLGGFALLQFYYKILLITKCITCTGIVKPTKNIQRESLWADPYLDTA